MPNLAHPNQHLQPQQSPYDLSSSAPYEYTQATHAPHKYLNNPNKILNLASGIKQILTSRLALVAYIAINPASRPINLTKPIPFSTPTLSTYADLIALILSDTDVSNPKDLSITGISLSIVFGTPTTVISSFRFFIY